MNIFDALSLITRQQPRTGRAWLRSVRPVALASLVGLTMTGCHQRQAQLQQPGALPHMVASPVPEQYMVPPFEPGTPHMAAHPVLPGGMPGAPPASLPTPTAPTQAPPAPDFEKPIAEAKAEIDHLKAELAAIRQQQAQSQIAMESLTASAMAAANRAAALEAHLALQSSLIDDLRTASTQQQREQWKALDAVSESIDRMLKKNEAQHPQQAQPIPAQPQQQLPPATQPAPGQAPGQNPTVPTPPPMQVLSQSQAPLHAVPQVRR